MLDLRAHMLDGSPDDVVERYRGLPSMASTSDFGVLDRNVVVVDTETTGLSFSHDELIQIAAARLECGEVVDWYVTFVDPGKNIEAGVSRIIHELCSFYNSDANNLRNVYYRNYNSKERYGIFVK